MSASALGAARLFQRCRLAAADSVAEIGRVTLLGVGALRGAAVHSLRWRAVVYQLHVQGTRALGLAFAAALFIGMALAVQVGFGLQRFGATSLLSQLTTVGLVRELLPVFSGLVIGGRLAAGIAAELGAMAATEQIDAMQVLGADPVRELVTPRVVAAVLVLPAITVLGDVTATVGAIFVSRLQYRIGAHYFVDSLRGFITIGDFVTGVVKSAVFGLLVSLLACRQGLLAHPSTQSVGLGATRAVVAGTLSVIVANYFLSVIALRLVGATP